MNELHTCQGEGDPETLWAECPPCQRELELFDSGQLDLSTWDVIYTAPELCRRNES